MRTMAGRLTSFLMALSLAGACVHEGTSTEPQSQFNDFEANQVLAAVANPIDQVDNAPAGIAATESINRAVPCSVAGTATVVGTLDPGPAVDFDARVTYTSCATASVTLNGIVDVTATSSTPSAGVVKITWTFLGTVQSKKDGITRSCTLDLTRVKTITNGATTLATDGNVCGRTVNN